MNYYERVHKSIMYIEENITNPIMLGEVAKVAEMSLTNFYTMFYSLVGYTVKEYIRRRRISHASKLLAITKAKIIDIAVECQFESQEAFTRAFKQLTGDTPKLSRVKSKHYNFERIDIMDTYFQIQDKKLLKKYPDIKVLKKIEPIRIAYYRVYGTHPENEAFTVLKNWAKKNKLIEGDSKYRVFSFDTPDSKRGDNEYGFEVWMSIDNDIIVEDNNVKSKTFEGGLYAVTSTKVSGVVSTWDRFREWLKISKYGLGEHQYLEEHLPFSDWDKDKSQDEHMIDLLMPLKEKDDKCSEQLLATKVVYYRVYGEEKKSPYEAWGTILEWANKNSLFSDSSKHRFFTYNNFYTEKKKDKQWYELMVTIDENFEVSDEKIEKRLFEGGSYITTKTKFANLPKTWKEVLRWQDITKTNLGNHQWVEEWILDGGAISKDTEMKIYFPV